MPHQELGAASMMEQREEKINDLLTVFFRTSGIEALYFDKDLNAISCNFSKYTGEDFVSLSQGKIESFLSGLFNETKEASQDYYTYFLKNNLICNIALLSENGACCGALVSQPVSLNMIKDSEINGVLGPALSSTEEQDLYKRALLRAPVIFYDRIKPLGEILSLLCWSASCQKESRQVLQGGDIDPAIYRFIQPGSLFNRNYKDVTGEKYRNYPFYLKIKDHIAKGDTAMLAAAMSGTLRPASLPISSADPKNLIRSFKNSFIKYCSIGSMTAIDAGAPYSKTMDLSDELIGEMETLDNINDIHELLKSAFAAFARAVAVSRITAYSKPVRLVIEYIENHYNERITLDKLSKSTNLSSSYLSSLIKKETGLSLAENINKIRVDASKKILLKSNVNITELSAMVGFAYSNHFARIFKQFTGMTPSEFKNSVWSEDEENRNSTDMLRLIADQLFHMMTIFPGVVDIGRIVDPIANIFWLQQPGGATVQGTCYDFWNRSKRCDTCISKMAFDKNSPFMKLDQKKDSAFFVLASPITVGDKRYVLELLKKISDNFFDCTGITFEKLHSHSTN